MRHKIVAIQQPEHLPWIGFFDKMQKCDRYVYLDNVQFKKRYFENRNRIRTKESSEFITIPVVTKGLYRQEISKVMIDNSRSWQRKYLGRVRHYYARAKHFDYYFPKLEDIIQRRFAKLIDLNLALIDWIRKELQIVTPTIMASQIREYKEKGSDLILAICKDLNAKVYISGPDGRNYLMLNAFRKEKIEVIYHDYKHPVYQQMHQPFISHMSVIDALFCEGKLSIKRLAGNNYAGFND